MAAELEARGHRADWCLWDDETRDWSRFDLVLIRSTWDYQRRRDEFLAWAGALAVVRNPAAVLAWNTDKHYLAELGAGEIAVIETTFIAPGDTATLAGDGEIVVKPSVSAGSKDTARFALGDDAARRRAEALLAEIHSGGRTAMVQPYLGAIDHRGETSLLYFGGSFSHAIRKAPLLRPGEGPTEGFFAPETIEPRTPSVAEREAGDGVIAWVAERFGELLYARVDLVPGSDGAPVLLELELTEPSLFFAHSEGASARFAESLPYSL
jgi:hypothetical protein